MLRKKNIYTNQYRKVWVLGDIHGADKALKQVLERGGFDNENDLLLFTGDVVDGFPESNKAIDSLMNIKNIVHIFGNHDQWAIDFYSQEMDKLNYDFWFKQGGKSTIESYPDGMPIEHLNFLKEAFHYCEISSKEGEVPDRVITHGGFNPESPLEEQYAEEFSWDRTLISDAFQQRDSGKNISKIYREIFVGHTPTIGFDSSFLTPQFWSGVWNMDTGASYTGKLSIMDIETKEVFQSDFVRELYPDHKGRNRLTYNEEKIISSL